MASVHRIGFTQLSASNPPQGGAYRVNIILVHGLRGQPRRTWEDSLRQSNSYERSTTPSKRTALRSLFKSKRTSLKPSEDDYASDGSSVNKVFWPSDYLVSDLPDARIWTYGYEADVIGGIFEANNKNSVSQHGRDLAVKLERDIDNEDPIVFVAHSLGGIIVKDALRRSKSCCSRTGLVVFLGTPHRGSSLAEWGVIASNLASLAMQNTSRGIVRTLEVNSEVLDNIQDEFQCLAVEHGIRIHSFQEARGMSGMKGLSGKVVDDFSSKIGMPTETVETIDANHMQMARCTDKADLQYRSLLAVLRHHIRNHLAEINAINSKGHVQAITNSNSTTGIALGAEPSAYNSSRVVFQPSLSRNKNFVGRSAILERLQDMLFASNACQSLAIVGLGGVGKTQVALQLAYWIPENKPEFSVFWISALSHASFEQAYTDIARQMRIPTTTTDEDFKECIRRHLESDRSRKWFLIVDNADDLNVLYGSSDSAAGIYQYLPKCENCLILFTTRSREVALSVAGTDVLVLEEMNWEEATSLLTSSLVQKQLLQDEKVNSQLLEELDYLPLAITQAAAYLNRNQISIKRYVELLQGTERDAVHLLSREFRDNTRYPGSGNAVATTWLVSFDQIRNTDPAAADLLSFISLIESKAIPRSLLPDSQTEETENAIGTLRGYTFLNSRQDENVYDMHRLVHMASKIWNKRQNRLEQTTDSAIQHLAEIFSTYDGENRELWRSYLPHATRLLYGSEDSNIEEKFELFSAVGQCLSQERRVKEAINCILVVYNHEIASSPEDNEYRLTIEHQLASEFINDRRIKEAIAIFEHVVKIRQETMDEEDHARLAAEHELARAYSNDNRVEDAITLLEHVVNIRRETLDEDDPSRLWAEHELARAYVEAERSTEAILILERVVNIRKLTLHETDHALLTSEQVLAGAYLDDGRTEEAIKMSEHVVNMLKLTTEESDFALLSSEHSLAMAYLADERLKEAIPILEQVVKINNQMLNETDYNRLSSEHVLAGAYIDDGRIDEAIAMFQNVVKIRKQLMNEHDPSLLASQHELARAYLSDGQATEAVFMFEDIVEILKQTKHERNHSRLISEHSLAIAYLDDGRTEEAIAMLEHVVEMRRQTLQENDKSRIGSENALKAAYEELQELQVNTDDSM